MSKASKLEECKTQADFARYARQKGAKVVNGGRHMCVEHKGRRVPLGHANGEIPVGTRKAIMRSLVALGLGAVVFVIWSAVMTAALK